jgi:type I restriction enzyme, S subunit
MESEWQKYAISDVMYIIGGGTPKRSISEYWNGDIPWLSVADFNTDDRHVSKTKETITDLGLQKSSTKLLDSGQLIISARGTVGALAQLDKPMTFNQSCYGLNAKTEYVTNDYLYYLVKKKVRDLQKITHGAVFDTITKDTFKDIEVQLPSLLTQKKIANILSTLDDKIELNRKMNQSLEEVAQALFKSWFVDFDPVHAKANASSDADFDRIAKELGISREILDLFPDEFEESELGMIPRGWDIKRLDDLSKVTMGQSPNGDSYNYNCNGLPLLNGAADFKDGILIPKKFTTDSKRKANHGELVFCIRATIGLLTYTDTEYSLGRGVASINAHNLHKELIYLGLDRKIERLKSTATGSVIIGLKKDDVESINFVVPNDDVMEFFHLMQRSIFDRIKINTSQTQALQKTRDTLIPKLLSGELDVSELELDNVTH